MIDKNTTHKQKMEQNHTPYMISIENTPRNPNVFIIFSKTKRNYQQKNPEITIKAPD